MDKGISFSSLGLDYFFSHFDVGDYLGSDC